MDADPSLAAGLQAPEPVLVDDPSVLVGAYARLPVDNDWHEVTVSVSGGDITWANAAGVSWGLELVEGQLFTMEDCPYGVSQIVVTLDDEGQASELIFGGEAYVRQ